MTKKLILDLDAGIDDAMALAYALASPEVELIGITTVFGNVPCAQSMTNCRALLELLGAPDVPVVAGADRALAATEPYTTMVDVHGANGLGGVELPAPRTAAEGVPDACATAAVSFLLDAARRYGEDLIYVPTGPLTNLARALALDAQAVARIGAITFMGGALTVPGNVTPGAEANIANDPEAADAVVRSSVPVTMVGLDVTHQTILPAAEIERWRALGTPAGEAFAAIVGYYSQFYLTHQGHLGGCALHDPLAVAAAIDPTLIGTLGINLKVDVAGPFRGRTVGDAARLRDVCKTVQVALTVDAPRFVARFCERLACALA